jgi:SDR family mycofactocin-dependent oxidoreductase
MGTLDGKVALVTGAARGQGRSHALRLAREGADIIALDRAEPYDTVPYDMPTPEDLAQTVKLVEELDRRVVARQADVRDLAALQEVVDAGVAELSRIDVVVANAGIYSFGPMSSLDIDARRWDDVVGTNLTGVFNTLKAAVPVMIAGGEGGSIVITSSTAGIKGLRSMADYTASKHGVVGLMRTFANELAEHRIRVNSVHPTGVNTDMVTNSALGRWYDENPSMAANVSGNLLPVDLVEAQDISEAVAWLVSDAARYVTGVTLPVDAGFTVKV